MAQMQLLPRQLHEHFCSLLITGVVHGRSAAHLTSTGIGNTEPLIAYVDVTS